MDNNIGFEFGEVENVEVDRWCFEESNNKFNNYCSRWYNCIFLSYEVYLLKSSIPKIVNFNPTKKESKK